MSQVTGFDVENHLCEDLRRQGRMGALLCAFAVVVVVFWAAEAEISGAVVSSGRLAVETDIRNVQHHLGGIVLELPVSDGELVQAGQVVARLDPTTIQAGAQAATALYQQLTVRRARLLAQIQGAETLTEGDSPSEELKLPWAEAEKAALKAEAANLRERDVQFEQRLVQLRNQQDGVKEQIVAAEALLDISERELLALQSLYEQGAISMLQLNDRAKEKQQLAGRKGELSATLSRLSAEMREVRAQQLQYRSDKASELYRELRDTEMQLAQAVGQKTTSEFTARAAVLRAPVTRRVHELVVHTLGAVVGPGESLMQIVPTDEDIIVTAAIDPSHVDNMRIGGKAFVRLISLSARTTPEVEGTLYSVSAETSSDSRTGLPFCLAKLRLTTGAELKELRDQLVPGMPVEVQIATSTRTVLDYALKPLRDQLERSFRED